MTDFLIAALAGAVTGVLSGFGVGGGSLLLIYMTSFAGAPQRWPRGLICSIFSQPPPPPSPPT